MREIKPNLPQWVDPGEVKHTFPPPNPDGIVTREPPRKVLDRYLGVDRSRPALVFLDELANFTTEDWRHAKVIVEGTPEFNRYFGGQA